MGYTDLWKCKVCGTLPEIEMTGKNFVVKCNVCTSPKTQFEGNGLDEVVMLWNRQNDPSPSLIERIKSFFKKKDEDEGEEPPEPATKAPAQIKSFFEKKEEEKRKEEEKKD
jgi:hypothetical protein